MFYIGKKMSEREMPITFLCDYTLLRKEHAYSECSISHTFEQKHASGRIVQIVFSYLAGNVVARVDGIKVNADVLAELSGLGRFDGLHLTEATRTAIDAPLNEIRKSVQDLLALVKYHLRHYDLHEQSYSVKSESWFGTSSELQAIPTTCSTSFVDFSNQSLNEQSKVAIQAALSAKVLPLVAMRHLHRAKHETQPHYKWIDATIAAELAVKETLCRAHPAMETMLIEMPSPPLSKMYGSLLKHYLGEESPFRKELIKGQEKRNVLVHRPGAMPIDQQEANDYVDVVEGAIFHLLSILYPHDELIRQARYRTAT